MGRLVCTCAPHQAGSTTQHSAHAARRSWLDPGTVGACSLTCTTIHQAVCTCTTTPSRPLSKVGSLGTVLQYKEKECSAAMAAGCWGQVRQCWVLQLHCNYMATTLQLHGHYRATSVQPANPNSSGQVRDENLTRTCAPEATATAFNTGVAVLPGNDAAWVRCWAEARE